MSLLPQIDPLVEREYLSTKAEIVDYYQEQGWSMARLARDLSPFSFDKNGNTIKPRNLERDFNPDRINKPTRTAAKKIAYEALGRTLPPKERVPPFKVDFKGRVKISDKWQKGTREFTCLVHGQGITWTKENYTTPPEEAQNFVGDGWEGWLFLAYMRGDDIVEDWSGTFTVY